MLFRSRATGVRLELEIDTVLETHTISKEIYSTCNNPDRQTCLEKKECSKMVDGSSTAAAGSEQMLPFTMNC